MIDRSRHATTGRFRAPRLREQSRGLPQVYGGRARRSIRDIYEVDHAHGGRNRFPLADSVHVSPRTVGTDSDRCGPLRFSQSRSACQQRASSISSQALQQPAPTPLRLSVLDDGLNWAIPKSNRLHIASSALTARYTIHEQVQRPPQQSPLYSDTPLSAHLHYVWYPHRRANRDVIPTFNPFKLYAATALADRRRRRR